MHRMKRKSRSEGPLSPRSHFHCALAHASRLASVSIARVRDLRTIRIAFRLQLLFVLALLLWATLLIPRLEQKALLDLSKIPSQVTIIQPEGRVEQLTYARRLMDAVDEAQIQVGDHDLMSLPANLSLEPGHAYELSITRRSEFTLMWSGLAVEAVSEPLTSVDLLSRSGYDDIDLSDGSRVEQPADDTLVYIAVDKREYRITEEIPFSKVYVDNPDLEVGKTEVTTPGQKGQRDLIFEEIYEDGVFISREQIGTEIIKDPVQEVISRGTKVVIKPIDRRRVGSTVLSRFDQIKPLLKENGRQNYETFSDNGDGTITVDGKTFTCESVSKRRITSYDGLEVCVHMGDHTPAINHNTFSGIPAQRGLVATYGKHSDGKIYPTLPLGTVVFIEGYGLGVIADLHASHSNHDLLDVCFDPGETLSGQGLPTANRTSYILSFP